MHFYVDESGSMKLGSRQPFVIAVLEVPDPQRLRQLYKYFVSHNIKRLRALDEGHRRMFYPNGKFKELKGSRLDPEMKRSFIEFFTREKHFVLHPVIVDNSAVKSYLYDDKARAFNLILKIMVAQRMDSGQIAPDDFDFQIDERNLNAQTKHTLCEYLNIELMLARGLDFDVQVAFFASETNRLVQLADVFANILYSDVLRGTFQKELRQMQAGGCMTAPFYYP